MPSYDSELLGMRIKRIRESRGLTLNQLATKTQVHQNTIRKAENGADNINISSYDKIADGLGVSLVNLLDGKGIDYVVHKREPIEIAKAERKQRQKISNRLGDLKIGLKNGKILAAVIELGKEEDVLHKHEGEEFFFNLTGKIQVTINDQEIVLLKGEAVLFWGDVPHGYRCVREEEDKISVGLSVISNSGYSSIFEMAQNLGINKT